VKQAECARLGAYMSKLLGSPTVSVVPGADGDGALLVNGAAVAEVSKDEEDGELSYCISLAAPRAAGAKKNAPIDEAERKRLEGVLKQQLHAAGLEVRARPRKTDSAEVYVGQEFIGTLSADEDEGYFLTAIILAFDLED
jgi:Protein of unknown function (DUF3126)